MRTTANRALTLMFVAAISLPMAANLATADGGNVDGENRALARFPVFDGTWQSLASYPAGVDRWFQDHFGFRGRLVSLNARIKYFGLGVSPSAAVRLGRDGWLFYADDGAVEDYANAPLLSDAEQKNWREAVLRARDWLKARGVAFVFTIAPDKHVVYADQMPDTVRQLGPVSRADQVYKALEGENVTVDTRPAILAAKARERVFHLNDTHWNERGAYEAYRVILEAVRRQVPGVPPPLPRSAFADTSHLEETGDLAGMMGLTFVLREEVLGLDPRTPRRARVLEPGDGLPDEEVGLVVTEIPGSTLPRAVIFRDSFVSPLVVFLAEHFSRAVFLWQNDFDANVILNEKPDVVIQEIVGRHLYTFTPSPELVPQP